MKRGVVPSICVIAWLLALPVALVADMAPIEQHRDFESRWVDIFMNSTSVPQDDSLFLAAAMLMPKIARAYEHNSPYRLNLHELALIGVATHHPDPDAAIFQHSRRVRIHPFSGWKQTDPTRSVLSILDPEGLAEHFDYLHSNYMQSRSRPEAETPRRFAVMSIFATDMLDQQFPTDFLLVELAEGPYILYGIIAPRHSAGQALAISPDYVPPDALGEIPRESLVSSVEELEAIQRSAQEARIRERDAIVHRAHGAWTLIRWMPAIGLSVVLIGVCAWWLRSRRRKFV